MIKKLNYSLFIFTSDECRISLFKKILFGKKYFSGKSVAKFPIWKRGDLGFQKIYHSCRWDRNKEYIKEWDFKGQGSK